MKEATGSRIRVLTSVILALLLALFAVGCGSGSKADTESADATSQEVSEQSDAEVTVEDEAGDEIPGKSVKVTNAGQAEDEAQAETKMALDEQGSYNTKDEVAWYLHTYGHLPPNYVTKDEAEDAGWKTEGLTVDEACPGKSIGGDRFTNRQKVLPTAKGRQYYECDIDYNGEKYRNAKRIVYSNDGLIFYTDDHYETFEQLY